MLDTESSLNAVLIYAFDMIVRYKDLAEVRSLVPSRNNKSALPWSDS